jgi:hypothetical protein
MRTRLAVILLCMLSVSSVLAQTTKSGFFKTSDGVRGSNPFLSATQSEVQRNPRLDCSGNYR